MNTLHFGLGNAKLNDAIATFSLPAGHTCPGARLCLSQADRRTGRITDGPRCRFRCFAASQESAYRSVRAARWRNLGLLKTAGGVQGMASLLERSLPAGVNRVRVHVSGDFFSEAYFLAWLHVARSRPQVVFYAYTKSLPLWVKHRRDVPGNFRLTASQGGVFDEWIDGHGLKSARVVFSTEEAARLGMEIDHDDGHAVADDGSFALLLHGTQPAGTEAARAWQGLKGRGAGYNEARKREREAQRPGMLAPVAG